MYNQKMHRQQELMNEKGKIQKRKIMKKQNRPKKLLKVII